jgi:hypothetical protein
MSEAPERREQRMEPAAHCAAIATRTQRVQRRVQRCDKSKFGRKRCWGRGSKFLDKNRQKSRARLKTGFLMKKNSVSDSRASIEWASFFFYKKCFELQQSVGMIGGKPYSAYYFYGYAGNSRLFSNKPNQIANFSGFFWFKTTFSCISTRTMSSCTNSTSLPT